MISTLILSSLYFWYQTISSKIIFFSWRHLNSSFQPKSHTSPSSTLAPFVPKESFQKCLSLGTAWLGASPYKLQLYWSWLFFHFSTTCKAYSQKKKKEHEVHIQTYSNFYDSQKSKYEILNSIHIAYNNRSNQMSPLNRCML